jgi:prepilin-type N-terminal cleavage/methylation domain-containing protein
MSRRLARQLAHPWRRRPAFTLVELLVVIGIITILIVLGVSVAHKVTGTGKKHVTENTIRALDTALNAYLSSKGVAAPPAWVRDPRQAPGTSPEIIIPVVDGRNMTAGGANAIINSVGLFMLQCKESPEANAAIKNLDPKIVREYDPDAAQSNPPPADASQPQIPTAVDGWGNPIRYVHPAFKGLIYGGYPGTLNDPTASVQVTVVIQPPAGKQFRITDIRRNAKETVTPPVQASHRADSDGGVNTTSRPYFYSAGPDGDPSTTEDNVYLTVPRFQKQ